MEKDQCFHLGYIIRTFRNEGQVVARFEVDDYQAYEGMDIVFLEIGRGMGLVPFFIDKMVMRQKNEAVLTFTDVNDEKEALHLKGSAMYLPDVVLPQLEGKQFYFHEVTGWTVEDINFGEVGTIETVIENPSNPLFQILNSENKEILIPLHDHFIEEVDRENRKLIIKAPDGLIEMFLSDENDD